MTTLYKGRTRRNALAFPGQPTIEALVDTHTLTASYVEPGADDPGPGYWVVNTPFGSATGGYDTEAEALEEVERRLLRSGWRRTEAEAMADAAAEQAERLATLAPRNHIA